MRILRKIETDIIELQSKVAVQERTIKKITEMLETQMLINANQDETNSIVIETIKDMQKGE